MYSILTGKLYIVPTPIGNLADITFRAIEVLKSVHAVLAEDTRQTKKLLDHYKVVQKLIPYHQHNEHKSVHTIIDKISNGQNYALCTDAGTPGISDPGFLIIREAIKTGIKVVTLPGAVAAIVGVVGSGLPCDTFIYEGFLPHKKGKQTKIKQLLNEKRTTIFYESPHRILKTIQLIHDLLGAERKLVIGRELTKKYEEYIRGNSSEILEHFKHHEPKGEFVLMIAGHDTK